jgi:hypothetical protein
MLLPLLTGAQSARPPVGAWREHLPYHSIIDVTASENKIFAATPFSFFSVDVASKEVERYSKISGLSETGISALQFDPFHQKLVVAYTNSNIDILTASGITNVAGLMRAAIAGDKTIYQLLPTPQYTYLATGLGILLLDVQKAEIKESWFIGKNGGYVKVNGVATDGVYIYAATVEGLKKLQATNANGADYHNWQTITTTPCDAVVQLGNKIIVLQNNALFEVVGNVLNPFYADGWPIVSIDVSENVLAVSQRQVSGESRIVFLNEKGAVTNTLQRGDVISFPQKAIVHSSGTWVADLYEGLTQWTGNNAERFDFLSPEDVATGPFLAHNGSVYAAAGSVNDAWNYQYNGAGIYAFKNEKWTNYNRFQFPQLDSLLDFMAVAIDPRDESIWGGSFGGGLLHIRGENNFDIYKQASPLQPAIGDPGSYRVSGLQFDAQQNLWISNYGAPQYLHVLKADGNWQSFNAPFLLPENAVSQIEIDEAGQKWIVSPKGGGVLVFNSGADINNTADDRWLQLKSGNANGNLPSNDVFALAKDKTGAMWIGTADGVAVMPCPTEIITRGCPLFLPVTKDGTFAGYLFKGMAVKSIAVDGANRKWMATKNGVWLVSEEGDAVLAHFTESNSPLLSNDVRSIAIDGVTGEVFFGTVKGICSFRGTATEAVDNNKNLHIFPNPVPPGYGGTIAIRNLAEGSTVKITELNGRLVYQTAAQGGQATWNGRDYKGQRAASGVYLVIVTDRNKVETGAGKIVFIH